MKTNTNKMNDINLINGTIIDAKKSIKNIITSKRFRNHFKLYSLIFISSLILSMVIGLKYVNLSDTIVFYLKNYSSLKYTNGTTIGILINNFFVSILLMCYFYLKGNFKRYFGVIYFIYNGFMGGIAIAYASTKYNLIIALSLIIPHGIIEIPAIIIAVSSGFELQDYGKNKLRGFIYVAIILFVLLAFAGYIEANITTHISKFLISYYGL